MTEPCVDFSWENRNPPPPRTELRVCRDSGQSDQDFKQKVRDAITTAWGQNPPKSASPVLMVFSWVPEDPVEVEPGCTLQDVLSALESAWAATPPP